jgi:fibronectin type 3 domain-containing protein
MKISSLPFLLLALAGTASLLLPGQAQDINLSGYTLTFDDEFNTSSITTSNPKGSSNWYALPPNGAPGYFSESNWNISAFSVSGGILTDSAYYANPAINGQNWQSGYIASVDPAVNGFKQQYGYFEIRCQMPNAGEGAWPSFWLDSVSGITGGSNEEIDVFEWYGVCNTPGNDQSLIQQASHNWNSDGSQNTSLPYLYSPQTQMPGGAYPWQGYHIYGCQIDPVHITWYIDGVQTNQIATPTSYITNPFYVMVDYALGGGWSLSGTPFTTDGTSSLLVDWVRVYSLPSGGGAPAAPTNLTATPGNTQVSLSWTASSGATSYNIYRGTSSGNETTTVATGVTGTSYTNTGLSNGTMYYYRITATNSSGTSGYSNEASATPTAGSGGQQLIGLQYQTNGSPAIGTLSAGVMAQSGWNSSSLPYVISGTYSVSNLLTSTGTASGISESTVCYGGYDHPSGSGFTSGTGNYDLFGGYALGSYGGVANDQVTLTGLNASTTYTLITYVGSSSTTDVISGSVSASGSSTYYIKGPVSNALTQGTATSSAAATAGNYFQFSNITGVTSLTFTLTDTGSNTACLYGFQVVASSGGGGGTAPTAPTNLAASPGNAQVGLSWTASSGATSYNIYRGTSSGNETTTVATGVTGTSYTDTGLNNGTMYYYRITATNSYGTSGYSNEASATPTAGGGGGQQIVGLQYQTNGSPAIGSLSAGVVSQSGWNSSSLPYVVNGTYSVSNLLTSTGTASGISESTVCYGGYDHPSGSGFSSGTGNYNLFGGFALGSYNGVPNVTVTLTGLNASSTYKLITYVGSSSSTDVISGAINVSGATTYYIKGGVSNVLTQGTATSSGAAAAGNYFQFTNITGVTSLTFTLTDTGSNTADLFGFQIVSGS